MTQALNLGLFANNLNSSGQLDATDGLTGAVPIANGGTGATTAATALAALGGIGSASPTITTPTIATIKSASSGVATVFQDSGGTQMGTLCRAWVNFNGTGTSGANQTIRGQFNIASVYKNGTGDYTINFTNNMPDINYCFVATVGNSDNGFVFVSAYTGQSGLSTSNFRIIIKGTNGVDYDRDYIGISVFR